MPQGLAPDASSGCSKSCNCPLLTKTLEPLNETLAGRDYVLGDLSGVDFMLGHACYMARRRGCMPEEMTHLHAYVKRLEARPAFAKGNMT